MADTDALRTSVDRLEVIVEHAVKSFEGVAAQLAITRSAVEHDRIEMTRLMVRLEAVQEQSEKTAKAVFTGNGSESLSEATRRANRVACENADTLKRVLSKLDAMERKRDDNTAKVKVAAITASGVIAAALATAIAAYLKA